MSIITWGQLLKSLIDGEKIEGAIARMIQEHLDNPEAHLGAGQSLQSHRMAEIIDHLALSIVTDKIKDKEVTVNKVFDDRIVHHVAFESFDNYRRVFEGIGGTIVSHYPVVEITAPNSIGHRTRLVIEGGYRPLIDRDNPEFQCIIDFSMAPGGQDIAFGMGSSDPWVATWFFGFRWDDATNKMFAYYFRYGVRTDFEILNFNVSRSHIFRAELSDIGQTLKFYLDKELIKVYTNLGMAFEADEYFCCANRATLANFNSLFLLSNLILIYD